ncbi:MAG: L-rhamnose isomerase [Oscillospiraceae bacterium]|jgi:L-rhamnose isomerase|nr:L-rhamnose isomerase [Oscillospiraceae bacterium]
MADSRYRWALERYRALGADTERALACLSAKPVSIHCWQGDDVTGFEGEGGGAGGGIQTTGNYPGRARNFDELKADFLKATSHIPGKKRVNLHACYAVFTANAPRADRDRLEYCHFAPWVTFAQAHGFGIDLNPTCFSHRMVRHGLTLSSPDEQTRRFWIDHCKATRRIANDIGERMGESVLHNIWIPDGLKDMPSDRIGPRLRLKAALDEIFAETLPRVIDSVESKVFGIGVESYTAGSNEFYIAYAASRGGVYVLLDNGHYHPTEYVSDKIPALLPFFDKIPLHITRGVRWDSDHVVLYDDELREIMTEVVRCDALDAVLLGLDFFDASVNRVAAWIIGGRSAQKGLLYALLTPHERLRALQDTGNFTEKMALAEEVKTLPFGDVWEEYCRRENVAASDTVWHEDIKRYEEEILKGRA